MGRNREAKGLIETEKHHNHKPQMTEWLRNITACHLFTTEVVWSKSTAVGIKADGCTEAKADEQKKKKFVPHWDRDGFNVTVFGSGTRHTTVSGGRVVVIVQFYFAPPHGRWQDQSSWRVKGQSPRVQTHTRTKTLHQYYKPQSQEHECINAQSLNLV